MFKHALTQDVAYASLLVQRRKELHGSIGLAIEELYADRLAEHYEMLAHHFSRAEDWERALDYLLKAAEKASAGIRAAPGARPLRRGAGGRPPAGRAGAGCDVMAIHRARADLFFGIGDFDGRGPKRRCSWSWPGASGIVRRKPALWSSSPRPCSGRGLPGGAPAGARSDRDRGGARGGGTARRRRCSSADTSGGQREARGPRRISGARSRSRGRGGSEPPGAGAAMLGAAARAGRDSTGRAWSSAARGPGSRGSIAWSSPLLRSLWTRGWPRARRGTTTRRWRLSPRAWPSPRRSATTPTSPASSTRWAGSASTAGTSPGVSSCRSASYEVTDRSSRAGHGTGAERRAFIRNNEADALMVQGDLAGAAEALAETLHIVQHPPPSRWMTWRYTTHCYASLAQLALLRGDPERARRLADQSLEVAMPTARGSTRAGRGGSRARAPRARRAWGEAEDALRRARASPRRSASRARPG